MATPLDLGVAGSQFPWCQWCQECTWKSLQITITYHNHPTPSKSPVDSVDKLADLAAVRLHSPQCFPTARPCSQPRRATLPERIKCHYRGLTVKFDLGPKMVHIYLSLQAFSTHVFVTPSFCIHVSLISSHFWCKTCQWCIKVGLGSCPLGAPHIHSFHLHDAKVLPVRGVQQGGLDPKPRLPNPNTTCRKIPKIYRWFAQL
jgi:hypothetical protein